MSIQYLLKSEQEKIITSARIGIIYGVIDAWKRRTDGPEEPDIIASLVLNTAPFFGDALFSIFEQFNIPLSMISVFCHQTPKVTFPMKNHQSCEIGDILFVYVHREQDITVRNALLYQAKISREQPYSVRQSDYHQLDLYMKWPSFKYVRSGRLSGKKRDVKPKGPHAGAQYMLIDDRPPSDPSSGLLGFPGTYPIGSCMPDNKLVDHNDLATELFNFLTLRSGRQFLAKNEAKRDGWSQLIWDLLTSSLSKGFSRRRSGYVDTPRLHGLDMEQLDGLSISKASRRASYSIVRDAIGSDAAGYIFRSGGGDDKYDEGSNFEEGNRGNGVSLVLIESSELSQERPYDER